MIALGALAEFRDPETGFHLQRTQHYVRILAGALTQSPRYQGRLTESWVERLVRAAPLHDIGKVSITDEVLQKPGKLTDEEFETMKGHVLAGSEVVQQMMARLDEVPQFFDLVHDVVRYHHERWDGKGYPYGVAGEEIPLSGRIMAVADVYDALITARVYKPAFSVEKAEAIIVEGRGIQFDPDVVDAFVEQQAAFRAVVEKSH